MLAITPIRRSIVMVKASSGSDNVTALLNVGSGAVAFAVGFPTGMKPASVAAADLNGDCKPLPLDEAIQALRRDPSHPVRVRVDEELTVEVRAVESTAVPKRSAADAFRELGRWEGFPS